MALIMAKTTLYHNPLCSKSRQTLALLRAQAIEPEIIEYLKTPPTKPQLQQLLKLLRLTPQQLMRKSEKVYKELAIEQNNYNETELLNILLENPILIERPIVVHNNQAIIARPPENIAQLIQ
jgi:arsenate reductase (glutaredoxin)